MWLQCNICVLVISFEKVNRIYEQNTTIYENKILKIKLSNKIPSWKDKEFPAINE